MAYVSKRQEVEDITLHVLKGEGSPFSFFHWIFIYPEALEDCRLHEVLVHECTHVRGWHSLDCIFSELFTILCWWNPFAWLMKQEVRINLEYLADESVLSDGNARKSYHIETVAREVSEQLPGNVTMQEKSSSSSVVANVALADSAKKAKQVEGTKKKAKSAQQSKTMQQSKTSGIPQSDKKSTAILYFIS